MSTEPGESRAETWSSLDSGRLCEECVSRVEVLMEEAQRLLTAGHFNSSVRAPPSLLILFYFTGHFVRNTFLVAPPLQRLWLLS